MGWVAILAYDTGCAYMCGKSGTYLYNGASYRDTDWYTITGTGGTVTFDCIAAFPLQMIFIWGANCANLQYDYLQVGAGVQGSLSHFVANGTVNWLWVAPPSLPASPANPTTPCTYAPSAARLPFRSSSRAGRDQS